MPLLGGVSDGRWRIAASGARCWIPALVEDDGKCGGCPPAGL